MPAFIIDNNLPRNISLWQAGEFVHVYDINPGLSDTEIWKHAIEHHLIIISKDADFSHRVLNTSTVQRFIHIKMGNCGKHELEEYIKVHWDKILHLIKYYRIVEIYSDHIEGIR